MVRNAGSVCLRNQQLEKKELMFLREREGALSGFSVGIPGNMVDPTRWFLTEASNVTDLAPVITLDQGDPHHAYFSGLYQRPMPPMAVMRSRYATVQHFTYHTGALGHTLYIGTSNAGKTIKKLFLTSQLLKYPNARAIIFDKDFSCEAATLLHDGTCIDLAPQAANSTRMNPLAFANKPGARAFLVGWIDRLMSVRGPKLTDNELEKVNEAKRARGRCAGLIWYGFYR